MHKSMVPPKVEGKIKKINSTSCVYILVGMANALFLHRRRTD